MNTRPDIFLSYNREDAATARRFAEAFEREGFHVWWDATLRSGEAYDEVTEQALRDAKAVVVLWSKKSVVSRWVRAEATVADRNRTLVPAMIEPCERPIMFELTQTAELAHWQGDAKDKAWMAFLSDVKRFVEKEAAPAQPAAITEDATPAPSVKIGERGDAPSIAVLPFTNRSGLAEDDVFSIGMVEDVIEALSQGVNVHVLASSATASFHKGAITNLPAIARQLGVRYLLEGNVRRAGANLRVTSQLIEAASGTVLWTQRFERPLSELAALQEDLVIEVATHLDAQVYRLEMERALKKPADLTAWEAATRSIAAYRGMSGEEILRAAVEARRALVIAPDYGLAHAALAFASAMIYMFLGPENPDEARRIKYHAERAVTLDPGNATVLADSALALGYVGQPEVALRHAERAIQLSPRSGWAHYMLGVVYVLLGRYDEALMHLDAELRLSPGASYRHSALGYQAAAYLCSGRWHDALMSIEQALALEPTYHHGFILKAIVLSRQGDAEAARSVMMRSRETEPRATAATIELWLRRNMKHSPFQEEALHHFRETWGATEPAT